MQTKQTYQRKCQNPCWYDSPSPKTPCEATLFSSHTHYDCFNCWFFKLFGKMTHFVLILKKTWSINTQRLKYLLFKVKLYNCRFCPVLWASESLTEVPTFFNTKDRQNYSQNAVGNDSTNSLHEINENSQLSVYTDLFFSSLPSLNKKTMQASWMMYCCT